MKDLYGFQFSDEIPTDFFRLITANLIGEGYSRRVYDCRLNPDIVIKIERQGHTFNNFREFDTWGTAKQIETAALWLAPCLHISQCGKVLIQERTYGTDRFPDKIPVWFSDLHEHNFGRLKNGRFVCHDYGHSGVLRQGLETTRQRKAKWSFDKEKNK